MEVQFMPIYEYTCSTCGKHHEIMQKITEEPLMVCPDCGGEMKKMISNTSFVLKGTGWYLTDYARDKKKELAAKDAKPEKSSESATEQKSGTAAEKKTGKKEVAVS